MILESFSKQYKMFELIERSQLVYVQFENVVEIHSSKIRKSEFILEKLNRHNSLILQICVEILQKKGTS